MLFLELLAVLLLTAVNGWLAMSELAIVSSRHIRLQALAEQGNRGARTALRLIEDPSRFLSTVQIGITLVSVVNGAFSGATLGPRLGAWLATFPVISPYGSTLGIAITVVGITYFSLIFGELVPKRIALAQPERIASLVAGPMHWLFLIAAPAVWLLRVSIEMVLRVLRLSGSRDTTVTEDEVKSLIAEGTQAGVFVPQEQKMIEGVLRLADRPVRVIMTPRSQLVWVDLRADLRTILDVVNSHGLSRLLVCDGTVDNPAGVVPTKDLLPAVLRGEVELATLLAPLLFVPESTSVLSLLDRFKRERVHVAIVVDEYGATEGLATLTDVLESIAGELPERGEEVEPWIVRTEDGWLVDGTLPIDEVETITGVSMGEDLETLAGFVLQRLGRIPETGASFDYGNARFEVVDMDGHRIDKVLIKTDRGPSATHEPWTDE